MNEMQSFYVRQKAAFDAFHEIEDQLREQAEANNPQQARMSLMERFLNWLGQDSATEKPKPQSARLNSR